MKTFTNRVSGASSTATFLPALAEPTVLTSLSLGTAAEPNAGDTYAAVTSRSYHSGGVNTLLMDGSVHFVSKGIQLETWRAFGTRAGSEVAFLSE